MFTRAAAITLALSLGADAAPYSLNRRKPGGSSRGSVRGLKGGSSRGSVRGLKGGSSRGGVHGLGGGGVETWKIIVIVVSIAVTTLFLIWFLPKYVFPYFKWWQRRMERKRLVAGEAQKQMEKLVAGEEVWKQKEVGGPAGGMRV